MSKKNKEKEVKQKEKCSCGCEENCQCDENCTCGCHNGEECTCGQDCTCGCHCDSDCECGCQDGEPCKCNDKDNETITLLSNRIKELEDNALRAQAELLNYRKRKDEETEGLLKYANEGIIKELLNVKDNFERALQVKEENKTEELEKFLSGFRIMYDELTNILKKFGVEEINRVGEIFDPNLEQALLTDNVPDKEDEEVLEVLLKGYKLKDRVIRPASVKINQK